MSNILCFSNTHNGSVALICNGEVKVAIQAERISRRKRQSLTLGEDIKLTQKCVNYCLNYSELKYKDLPKATPCFSPPDKPITLESTVIALDVKPM